MPEVVFEYPPNIDEIDAVLKVKGRDGIVYTYGEQIYAPGLDSISLDVVAHEEVHIEQQRKMTPEAWWGRYLIDVDFRIEQEVEAYRVQWQYAEKHYNREYRRGLKKFIAESLSSSMYGNVISRKEAERLITE